MAYLPRLSITDWIVAIFLGLLFLFSVAQFVCTHKKKYIFNAFVFYCAEVFFYLFFQESQGLLVR